MEGAENPFGVGVHGGEEGGEGEGHVNDPNEGPDLLAGCEAAEDGGR